MKSFEDYYKILCVNRDASLKDIKKAYHQLSFRYHPDKNDGNDDMFISIKKAYDILSDEEKRRRYDAEYDLKDDGIIFNPSLDVVVYVDNAFDGTLQYKRFIRCVALNEKGNRPYNSCKIDKVVMCRYCDGTGVIKDYKCSHCAGKGYIEINPCDGCDKIREYDGIQEIKNIKLNNNIVIIKQMGNFSKDNNKIGNLIIKRK